MKQRILKSGGQFYPEAKHWLLGWMDVRDTARCGLPIPCFTLEQAQADLALYGADKTTLVWKNY